MEAVRHPRREVHRGDGLEGAGVEDLEVLDASTLETVATVHLPARVPYGFHGNWVPTP